MNNSILITKDYGDLEVQVDADKIRLTMEELNLLADKLWRHSWEVDCDLVATNDKVSQYWVFGLFPSSDLESIAEGVREVIQDLFPDKAVKIK